MAKSCFGLANTGVLFDAFVIIGSFLLLNRFFTLSPAFITLGGGGGPLFGSF